MATVETAQIGGVRSVLRGVSGPHALSGPERLSVFTRRRPPRRVRAASGGPRRVEIRMRFRRCPLVYSCDLTEGEAES
ncbi:hypothetical protein DDQ41_11400 [Streptomyces spongiicola]|uniref:Uncharacterized protein n=1 Tax=Streptomyces spongiicola TaxID=1690221 RepID=A0ABM6V5V0_9ACTN|nr:hypothetical protein DDQ41_11400 [Streptomyces spongiicola]